MYRVLILVVAILAGAPALAQKWVDEKGKVYYGEPPKGVKVTPAPMTGGTTSTAGESQSQGSSAPAEKGKLTPASKFEKLVAEKEKARSGR